MPLRYRKRSGNCRNKTCRLKALRVKEGGRPGRRLALSRERAESKLGRAERVAQGKPSVESGSKAGFKANPYRFQKRGIMGLKTLNHSMLNLLCVVKF